MLIYIYYLLMLICLAASLFYLKYPIVKLLAALLLCSITTETIVEIIGSKTYKIFIVYHFFVIIEYALITLILRYNVAKKLFRISMLISIFLFGLLSLYISFFVLGTEKYPTINVQIEGLLIIIWCINSLISIQPNVKISIFHQPTFWISLAFFLYFASSISLNSIYNFLMVHRYKTAYFFYTLFNSISNYLLYILLIIGIVSNNERRSI